MSLEHMTGEQQEGGPPQAPGRGIAVAEKFSDEASVLINPEAEIPGSTTTKAQELVKPPAVGTVGILHRFFGRPGAETPEEVVVEEAIIPEPSAGGAGNGSEGRDGDGGGDGGNGPERPRWPDKGSDDEKDPKFYARGIVKYLQRIDRKVQRGEVLTRDEIDGYDEYCKELSNYADSAKTLDEDAAITAVRDRLKGFDQAGIENQPTPEQEEVLKDLLNDFDRAEKRFQEFKATTALKATKEVEEILFDEQGWQDQEAQRDWWETERNRLETEIVVKTLTQEERVPLAGLLDDFSQASNALVILENTLKNFESKTSSQLTRQEQDQIRNLTRRRQELLANKRGIEARIVENSSQFVKDRKTTQAEIDKEINRLKEVFDKKDEEKQKEALSEPEDWEKELEEEDREITVEPGPDLPTFAAALDLLTTQAGNPDSEEYKRTKEAVGWYFQEAGRLGMLYDLDLELDYDLEQYMKSLNLQAVDPREPVRKMTITQARRLIGANLQQDQLDGIESGDTWYVISPQQVEQFAGVRREYARRAYEQMRASLTNLAQLQNRLALQNQLMRKEITVEEYNRKLSRIPGDIQTERMYREWNFAFEGKERQRIEKAALIEGNRKLFRENYFQIELLGQNSREIALAAEQAAQHIIDSAGSYSLDAVRQRRELLIRAIWERIDTIQVEKGGNEEDAKDLIKDIQRSALNKLDFYILQWLAQNLRMDEYANYFEQTVMQDGTDRLKAIPGMSDGLVGVATWYLLKPEYRLFFRPGGFRNQLSKSGAQFYERNLLKDQIIEALMAYELKGNDAKEKAQTLEGLKKVQSTDEFIKKFTIHGKSDIDTEHPSEHPAARLDRAEKQYQSILKEVNGLRDQGLLSAGKLEELREARRERTFEQHRYQRAHDAAKNALEQAIRVTDALGESAALGAPSVIMDNGDHISVEDINLVYKYAVLQSAKRYGDSIQIEIEQDGGKNIYKIQDNPAVIRYRARVWDNSWYKANYDREAARVIYQEAIEEAYADINDIAPDFMLDLAKGFEETGLTTTEFVALQDAAEELRVKGYNARIGTKSFAEIIQMEELQPVLSNFIADYKASRDQVDNAYVMAEAAKGRLESVRTLMVRLNLKEPIEGDSQTVLKEYTRLIEDSRSLHNEMEKLVWFEAVHGFTKVEQEDVDGETISTYPYSPDRIDYGHQGLPWGIKRLQYLKAYWYTNEDARIQRGVDMVWTMPARLYSLSKESAAPDMLAMFWDMNRLEKDDNWTLMTFSHRTKDQQFFRTKAEGDIAVSQDDMKKMWGYLEKLGSDANSFWRKIPVIFKNLELKDYIKKLAEPNSYTNVEYNNFREELVEHLFNTFLSRFEPLVTVFEKQLSADRQALGSGAGLEENEKFALRFLEWLMSPKKGENTREEGGFAAYTEIRGIIRLFTTPNSYRPGSSIWDEVWRKLIPSHNPRLSKAPPEPTYELVLAA